MDTTTTAVDTAVDAAPTEVLPVAREDDRGVDTQVADGAAGVDAPPGAGPPGTRAAGGVLLGAVLLGGGLVGAVVSLLLLLDKLALLADPGFVPSCSIDPVLSCGTIMRTPQASVLGFPNPVVGLATFPVAAAVGALVLGGVRLPRWTWWSLQAGTTLGLLAVHWLIVQSLAVIHALCPWCMVAWVVVIAMFWFVTVHNLRAGHLGGAPAPLRGHGWGLAAWYFAIVVAVVATFPAWAAGLVGL